MASSFKLRPLQKISLLPHMGYQMLLYFRVSKTLSYEFGWLYLSLQIGIQYAD